MTLIAAFKNLTDKNINQTKFHLYQKLWTYYENTCSILNLKNIYLIIKIKDLVKWKLFVI